MTARMKPSAIAPATAVSGFSRMVSLICFSICAELVLRRFDQLFALAAIKFGGLALGAVPRTSPTLFSPMRVSVWVIDLEVVLQLLDLCFEIVGLGAGASPGALRVARGRGGGPCAGWAGAYRLYSAMMDAPGLDVAEQRSSAMRGSCVRARTTKHPGSRGSEPGWLSGAERGRPRTRVCSDPSHQHKDDDDHEHDAENTGREVSPGAGVPQLGMAPISNRIRTTMRMVLSIFALLS